MVVCYARWQKPLLTYADDFWEFSVYYLSNLLSRALFVDGFV